MYYDNVWHHVVVVVGSNYSSIYVDGSKLPVERNFDIGNRFVGDITQVEIGRRLVASPFAFTGAIDDVRIFNRALNATEISNLFLAYNTAPTANAGFDQAIRAGDIVALDGTGSFDDDTPTENLSYAWELVSVPIGSTAVIGNSASSNPSFVADQTGTYVGIIVGTHTLIMML